MRNRTKKGLAAKGFATLLAASMILIFGCTPQNTPPDTSEPAPPAPVQVDIDLSTLSISPRSQGDYGISADQGFLITGEDAPKWKEKELRAVLQTEPSFSYSLEKQEEGWLLTPSDPLERNQVYQFQAMGSDGKAVQSFAFQTECDLLVNSSYPSQDYDYVELDSGIEISFNTTGVSAEDFKAHFSIQPAVSGEFRVSGYTGIFVPSEPLQENTYYHVSLTPGLKAANGMELKEEYSYSFGTEEGKRGGGYWFNNAGEDYETFMPGDDVYFSVYTRDETAQLDYQISAYRFDGYQAYVDEIQKYNNYANVRWGPKEEYRTDTSTLQRVYQETQKLAPIPNSSQYYTIIPGGLEPGFYVMMVENTEKKIQVQKYFQICSLSVYLESASGNSLVWVNDPETGKPLENVEITFQDIKGKLPSASGKTNAGGIARISSGELARSSVTIRRDGAPIYYDVEYLRGESEIPLSEQYYLALYTDREIYQPSDTVHFWGVVAPRGSSGRTPASVKAAILSDDDRTISGVSVKVGNDNTFTGELSFASLEQGNYEFAIQDETGKSYGYHYLKITEYTKPSYILDISHSKTFYYANEAIDFGIKANYFDGSPVSGGRVYVNANGEEAVTLDETGSAQHSRYYRDNGYEPIPMWYPSSLWYTVSSGDQRDVYMSMNGNIPVVRSKIGIKTENDDDNTTLTIRANYLNEAKYGADTSISTDEAYSGPAANIPLRVVVNRTTYIKTPASTYYDPILKKTVTYYKTDSKEDIAAVLPAQTVNGVAQVPIADFQPTDDVSYWYQIEFDGGVNGQVRANHYPSRYRYYRGSDGYSYSFRSDYEQMNCKENDKIPLALYLNGKRAENKGKILYNVYQRDMLSSAFLDQGVSETSLTFTGEYIPSVQITGAYFDGRKVFTIQNFSAYFDHTDKALQLDISSNRETYRPGEEASITVKVSEPNASVCVGVVDESIFQLAPQQLDIAQQLYKYIYYPSVSQSASYKPYEEEIAEDGNPNSGMGGAGGGDSGYVREDFLDTALFQTVKADENGVASVKLTMPDNITSWRITAAAVTGDLKGGSNTNNTIVTQPFYLQTIVTGEYLTGDDISVSAMGVGTEASHGEELEITALLKAPDGTVLDTLEAKGQAGRQIPFNFGKRPEGDYILELSAKSGEYSDALRQPLSVVPSVQTEAVFRNVPFEQISALESVRYPVRVTVYNTKLEPYLQVLQHLMYRDTARTEALAASYEARKLYNALLPEEERESVYKDKRLEDIFDWESGGIRILPGSEADPAATAKMLIAAPDLANSRGKKNYFLSILSDPAVTQEQRVYAYLGLAALEQPILRDIQRLATEERPASEKLLLGAALASFGDSAGAEQILSSLSGLRREQNGLVWYEGVNQEETLKNTANALLLVSLGKTDTTEGDGMALWLVEQTVNDRLADTPVSLELLAYLKNFGFEGLPESKFSYMEDGKLQEVTLDERGMTTLSFYKDALEKADFKAISGDIAANVRTIAYSSGLSTAGEDLVQISKQYYPVYAENGFIAGQRVRVECTVTFSPDAPDGSYVFSDFIPSGMRYLPTQEGYRGSDYNGEISGFARNEGQKMNGYVYLQRMKEEPVEPLADTASDEPAAVVSEEPVPEAEAPADANPNTDDEAEENPNTGDDVEEDEGGPPSDGMLEEPIEEPALEEPPQEPMEPYDPWAGIQSGASDGPLTYTLVYYVSNTLSGEFQTETAVISSKEHNIRGESAPGTIVIR